MYTDAMQQVYTNVTKVLVESRQGSNLLYLPLDKIMQMSAQGDAAVPGETPLASGTASSSTVPSAPISSLPPIDARSRDSARSRDRETR